MLVDGLLDAPGDGAGRVGRALRWVEQAIELVHGADAVDGDDEVDGAEHAIVEVEVVGVAGLDEDEPRAHALGLSDVRERADAELLGLVARGDDRGGVGEDGDDGDGFAAERGVDLLLARGEEGVEVDVEVEEGHWGDVRHAPRITRS